MTMFDLVIKNGCIVLEDNLIQGSIGIKDEKIKGIFDSNYPIRGKNIIDAKDMVIMPGAVDCHSHIWEPTNYEYREDFYTGSCSAASGGITTLIEMPLSVPPVEDKESFEKRKEIADKKIVTDYSMWGAFTKKSINNIKDLRERGCKAFKAFLSFASPEYPKADDDILLEGMKKIAGAGGIVGLHAENDDLIKNLSEKYEKEGKFSGDYHEKSRPEISEIQAIQKAIAFAEEEGCKIHICHLSSAKGYKVIEEGIERGNDISVETCPHYLTLSIEDLKKHGGHAKCNPPLRSLENREKLWSLIKENKIKHVGSDHTTYTDEDRDKHGDNIWKMPPGIGGTDLFIPLLVHEGYHKRGVDLVKISRISSTNNAIRFGLYPKKGAIRLDSDADLIIVDLNKEWKYKGGKSFSKAKTKKGPYENRLIKSQIIKTIVRGKVVYDDKKIKVERGYGKFIKPL